MFDVAIIGAGPAGLNAALVLGQARRKVFVCESGEHRNAPSYKVHAFLGRDGISPQRLLAIGQRQLQVYKNIILEKDKALDIRIKGAFEISFAHQKKILAKKIILATGIVDELPAISGIKPYFGISVFVCPYCDGWEVRNRAIAVYGQGNRGPKFALTVARWSRDVILCSDGPVGGTPVERQALQKQGIQVIETPIARVIGARGWLKEIVFEDGHKIPREVLFFNTPRRQRSDLAQKLGCGLTSSGDIRCDRYGKTDIQGVFVAGDIASDFKMAIVAASDGAKAAYKVNCELIEEEYALKK